MINTSQDFDTALDFVVAEQDTFSRSIDNTMDAGQFNSIFQEMEEDINNLYEKIRVLEDIKNYTREFVLRDIEERRKKIVDSLKVIETNVSEYQNPEYQVEEIGFSNVVEEIRDRDGSVIPSLKNEDGKLVTPHKELSSETLYSIINNGQVKFIPTKVTVDGVEESRIEFVPFSEADPFNERKLDSFEDRNTYRAVYESEQPVEDGIVVEYEIQFLGRADCNYFDMHEVNCDVESVILTNSDNQSFEVPRGSKFFGPSSDITKAIVRVRCKQYDRVYLDIPDEPLDDAFDKSIVGSEMSA